MARRIEPWMKWSAAGLGAVGLGIVGYSIATLAGSGWPSEGDSCSLETYREILGPHVNDTVVQRAWQYLPLARHAARQIGVEPALLEAVIHTESRWSPEASSGVAVGLVQMIASTAASVFRDLADANQWPFTQVGSSSDPQRNGKLAELGVAEWVDRTDPRQSVWLGAALLRALLGRGNGERWALAAYNGGPGGANDSGPQGYATDTLERKAWYAALERACGGLFA
jgi:soluble lytic murein transglycosylase-like protein